MKIETQRYFSCCGKGICRGCIHSFARSFHLSGMEYKCPFCNTGSKGNEEQVQDIRKRVVANDPASIFMTMEWRFATGCDGTLH
jgi:hypothetical protein